jgi:DNA repair protein RadC
MNNTQTTYRIEDMEVSDQPREHLAKHGAANLTNQELLAILLRVGVAGENAIQLAQRLLDKYGGIYGLHRAPFEEVCLQRGIGQAKAAQIKAALGLGHRVGLGPPDERVHIHSPQDAAKLVRYEMSALEQEEMRILLLDTRNRVIDEHTVYKGSLNSSQIRVGELFKFAIRRNAAAIILVHNHPSGAPRSM